MKDKAVCFGFNPKTNKVEIGGRKGTMLVNKTDAYRLAMVCLAADPRWEMLPADWRNYFVRRTP